MIVRLEKWLWLPAALLIAARLALVLGLPLDANTNAIYDDFLFLRLADSLRSGYWLGWLDVATLIKGPFYPLWIALVDRLGLSLLMSEQALYVLACGVMTAAVRPVLKNPWLRLLLLAVLLFSPVSYSYASALRTLREAVYPALTLLTLACAAGLALRWAQLRRLSPPVAAIVDGGQAAGSEINDPGHTDDPGDILPAAGPLSNSWSLRIGEGVGGEVSRLLPWSLGLGLSFGAFWLTREEGIWLLPSLGLLLLAGLLLALRRHPNPKGVLKPIGFGYLLAFIAAAILPLIVFSFNNRFYGVFNKTELDDRDFRAAYGALIRVRSGELIPKVPVSRQTRRKIYAVSPAFNELEPYLEGDIGKAWRRYSEKTPEAKGEITAGLFIWAFRASVDAAGYYQDGLYPRDYYRRLAAEIHAACAAGRLDCYPPRATLTPPLHRRDLPAILRSAGRAAAELLLDPIHRSRPTGSTGDPDGLALFSDLTGDRISGDDRVLEVKGSVYFLHMPDNTGLEVAVTSLDGGRVPAIAEKWSASPNLYAAELKKGRNLTAAKMAAFRVRAFHHPTPAISVFFNRGALVTLPIQPGMPPQDYEDEHLHLSIDKVTVTVSDPAAYQRDETRRAIRLGIAAAYRFLSAPASFLALLATLWLLVQALRRRAAPLAALLALALLAAVAARVGLLALIDATSFPAIGETYLSAAQPLLVAWIVLSLSAAAAAFRFPGARSAPPAPTMSVSNAENP